MFDSLHFIPLDRIAQIAVYVIVLLNAWILFPPLAILVLSQLIRKLGIDRRIGFELNTRGFAVFTVPILASFEQIMNLYHYLWPLLIGAAWTSGTLGIPAAGSADRFLGEQIFGFLFAVYNGAMLPISFGLPFVHTIRQLPEYIATPLTVFRWTSIMTVAAVAYDYPGNNGWIVALASIIQTVLILRATLWAMATVNFNATPEVKLGTGEDAGRLYFMHISDVHATIPEGSEPAGGGRTGTNELASVANDIAAKRRVPVVLVDTGDIVDRGRAEEWNAPLNSLRRIKEAGTHVVIAPGNHDLVPSYNFSDALWAVSSRRFTMPQVDGVRLLKYLTVASGLEPRLCDCNGNLVRDIVSLETTRFNDVVASWDWIRDQAIGRLGKAGLSHRAAVSQLRSRDPAAALQLENEFVRRALIAYPETIESAWRHLLIHSAPQHLELALTSQIWARRWTELFPLRLEMVEDNVEFLIMNSIAKEARLAGSALGLCGEDQLQRLSARLHESSASVAIILHHHACFRFPREASDPFIQRWAMLAHDRQESRAIAEILSNASASKKQIIMLSGHVHLRSRCGQLISRAAADGDRLPIWVLEGGALGEKGGEQVPSGWLTPTGLIEPRLVPRTV